VAKPSVDGAASQTRRRPFLVGARFCGGNDGSVVQATSVAEAQRGRQNLKGEVVVIASPPHVRAQEIERAQQANPATMFVIAPEASIGEHKQFVRVRTSDSEEEPFRYGNAEGPDGAPLLRATETGWRLWIFRR